MVFERVYSVGHEVAFVFGMNGGLLGFRKPPDTLVHFGTDQDLRPAGGGAVTSRAVDGVTDDRKFHAIRRANESVHDLATVNSNAKIAARSAAKFACFV